MNALIDDLVAALYTALPFVEDALDDPAFKKGAVAGKLATVKAALARSEKEKPLLTLAQQEQLLDVAEDITRCASVHAGAANAYFIDGCMPALQQIVTTHRPIPYRLEGGRKIRP